MSDLDFLRGSHNPLDLLRSARFDLAFYRNNPDYFRPCGTWVYCGEQGSGKTLSAVKTVKNLLKEYPQAQICSNLVIHGIDQEIIPFTEYEQIREMSNGIKGIIFLIDEIQVLWNSLESRNIPVQEIGIFSQMRKDRRLIIGTSQVYGRIAKPIREQLKYVVMCRNIAKYLQINTIINPNPDGYTGEEDGRLCGEILKRQWFFHSPDDYKSYDTLAKVLRISRKGVK